MLTAMSSLAPFRRFTLTLTLALAASLAGCATTPQAPALLATATTAWQRSEVWFGLSRPDGTLISRGEWQAFVDEEITPRFPAGLSVLDVSGQWRNTQGHIDHEASKLLVLLHPADARVDAAIDEIRTIYCLRFGQEAVMKVTTPAQVDF